MNDVPVKSSPKIELTDYIEHEDGSATVIFDMDQESIKIFAQIGLLKVIIDQANSVIAEDIDDNVGC